MPEWPRSHAHAAHSLADPHTFRAPTQNFTESRNGCIRRRARRTHVGTSLTRFVARSGAHPNTRMATFACARRAHFGTPRARFVAP
eukprot:6264263-Pyramimonas_sp.AAC.1